MGASDPSSKRAAFFEKTEPAMLVLAIVAVTLYLADLIGFWKAQGLESVYSVLAMTIDIVFFFDFVLKACLLRGPYFKSVVIRRLYLSLAGLELFTALRVQPSCDALSARAAFLHDPTHVADFAS